MIRRRLFWKIYLTLLSSLLVVAVLMGGLWWLLGETSHDRWGAFRIHLNNQLVAEQENTAGAATDVVRRLGNEIGADISLYDKDGRLVASRGSPITAASRTAKPGDKPHLFMRIDLPDGRTVLVHLVHPRAQRLEGILVAVLIVAGGVGLAAFPMTARLTRQLEALRTGMARWGQGDWTPINETGSDEVATVARTFNTAAERITALLASQRALLASASHELRSPLARLRLAVDLWLQNPGETARGEIVRNLAELDGLVEEILLCSRLDHPASVVGRIERVDLLGLAAEEAARLDVQVGGGGAEVDGNETLLRRLIRNLLENAVQHGAAPVSIDVEPRPEGGALLRVADAGPGIPEDERLRIFEPFYRPAGHGDAGGGWGLGLALVQQIATRHGGRVTCEGREGGGTVFVAVLAGAASAGSAAEHPPVGCRPSASVGLPGSGALEPRMGRVA